MKTCRVCGSTKPLADFPPRKDAKDGCRNDCRICHSATTQQRYVQNAEERRAAARKWHRDNLERSKRNKRLWKERNRDRVRALDKEYRQRNAEVLAERSRWKYQMTRDRHQELVRNWFERNPDARLRYWHNRRARMRDAFDEAVDRSVVWERDAGVCGICNRVADPNDWHLDHVVPLAVGGRHSYANTQVSHPACNLAKGSRY